MKDAVAQLAEVRIVHLAHAVEEAYEAISRQLVGALQGDVRVQAEKVLEKGPAHARLEEMHASMSVDLEQWLDGMRPEEILQALMGTERAAHDFYRSLLDDVRDATLSQAFIELMREEAQHVAAVEQMRRQVR